MSGTLQVTSEIGMTMLQDVTFGITAFERPHLLENLVASISKRYPTARIVVADNGRRKARLPSTVRMLNLEFDCGLSQARNALADQLETKYLLILEDDFLFTDETRIERLVEVLEQDAEIGVVCGALRGLSGRVSVYALDIEVFRQTMYVREAPHRVCVTRGGVPYRLCDMCWNFALFRREMLEQHRWDPELKVGEHAPFFHQVKLGSQWRVAACPTVVLYHVPDRRSADYLTHRQRSQQLFQSYLQRVGIKDYRRVQPTLLEDEDVEKPCVVVLGVGHSGTSVLTRMLHALGWEPGDADTAFAESVEVRNLNHDIERFGILPPRRAHLVLARLPRPWAIKDPRFVRTLHHWLPHFSQLEPKPVLMRITRSTESLVTSFRRRQTPGDVAMRVEQLLNLCRQQYEAWPWMRMTIDYERLGQGVAMFDAGRFHKATQPGPRPLMGGPWRQQLLFPDSGILDGRALFMDGSGTELLPLDSAGGLETESGAMLSADRSLAGSESLPMEGVIRAFGVVDSG